MVINGRLHDQITAEGNKKTSRNPTDKGIQGVKRSMLMDANVFPQLLVVVAANMHDIQLVADIRDALQTECQGQKLRLCLDKGYDAGWLKTYIQSRISSPVNKSLMLVKTRTSKPIAVSSKELIVG